MFGSDSGNKPTDSRRFARQPVRANEVDEVQLYDIAENVAPYWRSIANRLHHPMTASDVDSQLPPIATDRERSARLFSLIAADGFPLDQLWAVMKDAGLTGFIPQGSLTYRPPVASLAPSTPFPPISTHGGKFFAFTEDRKVVQSRSRPAIDAHDGNDALQHVQVSLLSVMLRLLAVLPFLGAMLSKRLRRVSAVDASINVGTTVRNAIHALSSPADGHVIVSPQNASEPQGPQPWPDGSYTARVDELRGSLLRLGKRWRDLLTNADLCATGLLELLFQVAKSTPLEFGELSLLQPVVLRLSEVECWPTNSDERRTLTCVFSQSFYEDIQVGDYSAPLLLVQLPSSCDLTKLPTFGTVGTVVDFIVDDIRSPLNTHKYRIAFILCQAANGRWSLHVADGHDSSAASSAETDVKARVLILTDIVAHDPGTSRVPSFTQPIKCSSLKRVSLKLMFVQQHASNSASVCGSRPESRCASPGILEGDAELSNGARGSGGLPDPRRSEYFYETPSGVLPSNAEAERSPQLSPLMAEECQPDGHQSYGLPNDCAVSVVRSSSPECSQSSSPSGEVTVGVHLNMFIALAKMAGRSRLENLSHDEKRLKEQLRAVQRDRASLEALLHELESQPAAPDVARCIELASCIQKFSLTD